MFHKKTALVSSEVVIRIAFQRKKIFKQLLEFLLARNASLVEVKIFFRK